MRIAAERVLRMRALPGALRVVAPAEMEVAATAAEGRGARGWLKELGFGDVRS